MACGCKDKDVAGIAEASAKRNSFIGVPGAIDKLVDLYRKHKGNLREANTISQAKIKDFDNPLVLGTAVRMAREYKALLDNLAYVTPKLIAEVYADKVETGKHLNNLQRMASQTYSQDNSQGKSTTKSVKKGKK